jgi:hypothetical protein
MRIAFVLLVVACGSSKQDPPPSPAPVTPQPVAQHGTDVHVDRRIELISIVERLAGGDEYRKTPPNPYLSDVDATFAPFAEHPAVATTRALRAKQGISFDAPMILAAHLDDKLELRAADELPTLDKRWAGVDVAAYAAQLRDFATASKLDAFFDAHRAHYTAVANKLRAVVDAENPVGWFDKLFGPRKGARFFVVPGLLTGRMNYGVRANLADGSVEMFQVLGVMTSDGIPATDDATVALLVHEMAHSYINPLFAQHRKELEPAGTKLFPLVAKQMSAQHYTDWVTVLNESGVRATTVLYFRQKKGDEAGARAARSELRAGFVWTNELVEVFRKTTIESRMPEVVAFFDRLVVQYKDGLPKTPFLGPVDAVMLNEPVVVVSNDPELAAYVKTIHDKLFNSTALVTGSVHVFADTPDKPLMVYGSPSTNPAIATVLGWSGWKITATSIALGKRTFDGPGLVLVACWYRRDAPTLGVAVYAAARDRDLVGINHNLHHGPNDWLVARRTAKGYEVLASGDFPRAVDGAWLLP